MRARKVLSIKTEEYCSGFNETLAAPFSSLVANLGTGAGVGKVLFQQANEIWNLTTSL